jgi:hypothetical protein
MKQISCTHERLQIFPSEIPAQTAFDIYETADPPSDGVIVECAFQEGDVFVTTLTPTPVQLTYDVVEWCTTVGLLA